MNLGTADILRADSRHLPLADNSVDLVVTSPPYFALRSYQDGGEHYKGQIGDEPTPDEFVTSLLEVTRECVRVLKPSGSLWVNLGDKYDSGTNTGRKNGGDRMSDGRERQSWNTDKGGPERFTMGRPKSLIGIPWRYALRCIDDLGLILRAEVIWSKPNGLPESVTDRVRRSHEQWFHFTLQPRYFSAVDEIREQYAPGTAERYAKGYNPDREAYAAGGPTKNGVARHDGGGPSSTNPLGKLPGSVWTVPTEPLRVPDHLGVDHFAAFPTEWPKRIIQGWSPAGVCVECGEGRRPVVAKEKVGGWQRGVTSTRARGYGQHVVGGDAPGAWVHDSVTATVTGYACACLEVCDFHAQYGIHAHMGREDSDGATCCNKDALPPTRPAVVLDPFGGTGTTAMVAKALGRHGISVDMSADYCRLAEWRTNDRDQLAKVLGVAKVDSPTQDESLFDLLDGGAA